MRSAVRQGVVAVALFAGLLAVDAADAAVVTFDFRSAAGSSSSGPAGNERVFSSGDLTVRVAAGTKKNGALVAAYLAQDSAGLGVTEGVGTSETNTIEGEDFVNFAFERAVRPISVVLNVLGGGPVSYSVDPVDATLQQQGGPSSPDTLTMALLRGDRSSFQLFAQAGAPGAFTVQSFMVAAPVPAALPLLATALAGLGVVARRRGAHLAA